MATLSFSAANGMKSKSYVLTYSVSSSSTATTVTLTSVSCESSTWTGADLTVFFYADSTATLITSFEDTLSPNQTKTINKTHSWNKTTSAQTKRLYVYVSAYVNGSYVNYGQASVEISVPALASYNVTYNANGGSGAPATQKKYYGVNLTLSVVKPTRSGFSFVKWFTKADGTGTGYNPGATYSTNAALNLYAKWSAVPSVTSLKVIRSNSAGNQDDSGTYAKVTATWTMDSSTGESATVTGAITPQGGTASAITLSGTTTGTGGTVTALVPNMDTDTQYVVAITAANGSNTATRSAVLTRAFFIMDFKAGGGGIGIGRAAPSDSLAVGYNAEFDGNVNIFGTTTTTGVLKVKSNTIDTDAAAPSSTQFLRAYQVKDKDDDPIGFIEAFRNTSNNHGISLVAARNVDGAEKYNNINVFLDSSGNPLYSVSGQAAFRSAISAMGANTAKGYTGMTHVNGSDVDWIRTTQSGIIPYASGGSSALGTSSWPFNNVWANHYQHPKVTGGVTYIDGNNGNAALYLSKNTGAIWYPAVTLDTTSGGSWSIGNYNTEDLVFSWASKANRDANTNSTNVVCLPNNAGTIPVPVQLYYNATGVTGTVTLSQTAANFNYLRIFFRATNDSNQCGSVDVYSPNNKHVSLQATQPASNGVWIKSRLVKISATSITNVSTANGEAGQSAQYNTDNTLYIYRVEGWK